MQTRGLFSGLLQATLVVVVAGIGLGSAAPLSRWSAIERVSAPEVTAASPVVRAFPRHDDVASIAPELESEVRTLLLTPPATQCALRSTANVKLLHSRSAPRAGAIVLPEHCSRE